MDFSYVSTQEYNEEKLLMESRFSNLRIVPETRKLHHISSVSQGVIKGKYFSFSSEEYVYALKRK